jgi:hypothetical protein
MITFQMTTRRESASPITTKVEDSHENATK